MIAGAFTSHSCGGVFRGLKPLALEHWTEEASDWISVGIHGWIEPRIVETSPWTAGSLDMQRLPRLELGGSPSFEMMPGVPT